MTNKQQVKKDTPKAVELNKAALDRVAGGGNVPLGWFSEAPSPINNRTSNTILKG